MRVNIIRLGSASKTYDVPAGSNVQGALDIARIKLEGMTVNRDSVGVSLSADVRDGDTLFITPKVTGGVR